MQNNDGFFAELNSIRSFCRVHSVSVLMTTPGDILKNGVDIKCV